MYGFEGCEGLYTVLSFVYGVTFDPRTRQFSPQVNLQRPDNDQAEGSGTNGNRGAGGGFANGPAANVPGSEFIVGYQDDGPDTPYHAFRTTLDTNSYVDLGTLDPLNSVASSFANDVGDDGAVVAGHSDFNSGATQHAFRWTQAGGMIDLGSGNGASGFSRAFGISGNGATLVGDSDFASGPRSAFLWTQGGGFQNLGSLGGSSLATVITQDASVVVGQAGLGSNNSVAFRWTQATGMVSIGALSGDNNAAATGASDNGKIVVGISASRPLTRRNTGWDFGTDTRAFRWSQSSGMQDLATLLTSAGVDLTGITLVAATGISSDGQFIVGQATTPEYRAKRDRGFRRPNLRCRYRRGLHHRISPPRRPR